MRILAAAVLQDGVIYSAPAPGRHHHVMMQMLGQGVYVDHTHIQGFVTDTGVFLNRKDALAVASGAGQLIRKTAPDYELFSEDLW
jgi:hypothetical protein